MAPPRARYLFAGAGVSGLTLAARLLETLGPDETMVLVDPALATEQGFDRTLGFHCVGDPPFAALLERSWDRFAVWAPRGEGRIHALTPHRYHALRWSTLRAHLLATLGAHPGVRLIPGRVGALFEGDGGDRDERSEGARAWIDGDAGSEVIAARWIFDGRLDPRALVCAPGRVSLSQHFHGVRLQVDDGPSFDPDCAIYMDLRAAAGADELAFLHLLPEGPRHALIYRIEIGPHPKVHRDELDHDLRAVLGLRRWQVLARERGVLPMTDQRFVRRAGRCVLRIGNAGGRLKPSSGYALTRILADNQAIAASLARRGHPFDLPRDRAGLRLLDGVLLEIIGRDPALGAELLAGLFARCEVATILRFLDEAVGARELWAVMRAMPHKPLLAWTGLRRALAWLRRPGAVALPAPKLPPKPALPPGPCP